MQTKEQKRAKFALDEIAATFGDSINDDTSNFLNGVPTMILMNGLGQTLAYLLSKANGDRISKYGKTYTSVKKWLSTEVLALATGQQDMAFLNVLAASDLQVYLQAQREALAYLGWLKRYARAFKG